MKYLFWACFSLLFLQSCSDISDLTYEVGEDFVDSSTRMYFIDSLTVESSTFKFDTLVVSSANRLLIGSYKDEYFGNVKSETYSELINNIFDIDEDAKFDSIAILLDYDSYYYGDTLPVQKIKVYEVLEDIEYGEDEYQYYNFTSFISSSTEIADQAFKPRPNDIDSLHISINTNFGQVLFNKLKNEEIENSIDFLEEYKGILIQPDDDNTVMLGFSMNGILRIYYSLNYETDKEEKYIDITFNTTDTFNSINSDKTATYFETLVDQETYLSSDKTDDLVFIQAGVGIATKIDIPFVEQLYDIPGDGILINANLKISMKESTSTENLSTRDSLQVYIINDKAEVLTELTDENGTPIYGLIEDQNGEFNYTKYNIDIKTFLDLKLSEYVNEDIFLAIYSQGFNSSVDRYIFNGDGQSNDTRTKLEITYAVYDE